jgi:glycosyltransferase involved in cell wall biosynthesis
LHGKILASADFIVALSKNMKQILYSYPIQKQRVKLISIWSDEQELALNNTQVDVRRSLPEWLKKRFIIHYSGNLGLANYWKPFFDVISRLVHHEEIGFLFTGGGPQMPTLQHHCSNAALPNVYFRPYVNRDELAESMAIGDLNWLSLKHNFEGIAYPSKLIGYMSAAKPVVFIGSSHSDSATLIQKADCGISIEPEMIEELCNKLIHFSNNQIQLTQKGKNGQDFVQQHVSKNSLTEEWIKLLKELSL